jgi:hypothetical protein
MAPRGRPLSSAVLSRLQLGQQPAEDALIRDVAHVRGVLYADASAPIVGVIRHSDALWAIADAGNTRLSNSTTTNTQRIIRRCSEARCSEASSHLRTDVLLFM